MTLQRSTALAVTLLTTAPGALWAAEEGGSGPFSVNPGLTIWTSVIFLVLLGILWKYAWGPILGAIAAREEGIQSDLDQAAREREEATRLLAEHKEQLADSRRQAQQILNQAREAADELRKELEVKAREESQAILERARAEIGRERDQALDMLRQESVELALAVASKLIHQKLDADADRELVREMVSKMESFGGTTGEGARA